ncbi:hypothetical protein GE09DRAFT_1291580 [Coniochaeta sp. 2T2.1]|nr:hypothetical protein GE09DRAFT_1291580 [Coniochaeta sp. 2T2.1]
MTFDPDPLVVLISGASRGLGRGLAERYLLRPDHTVIAANRDPSSPSSQSLLTLPHHPTSRLILVKLDATIESDAAAAVRVLQTEHGIDHLDIVIANAGAAFVYPYVRDVKSQDLREHLDLNVFGVLWLFQATRELLRRSSRGPKWVTMGSSAGSLANTPDVPSGVYGASKAMVHWLTKRVHFEEDWLTSFVMHPGWIQTDMGLHSTKEFGMDDAMTQKLLLKNGESHPGMMKVIDEATRETHGGKFWNYEGTQEAW